MDGCKTWKRSVDSDDEIPLFAEGWAPKVKCVDSDDEVPSQGLGAEGKSRRF